MDDVGLDLGASDGVNSLAQEFRVKERHLQVCEKLIESVGIVRRRGDGAGGRKHYYPLSCTCEGQNLGKWAGHGPFPAESKPKARQKFKTCRGSCELPTVARWLAHDTRTALRVLDPTQIGTPSVSLSTRIVLAVQI